MKIRKGKKLIKTDAGAIEIENKKGMKPWNYSVSSLDPGNNVYYTVILA